MSIDHIKKQAKRLSRLLPEHLATHKEPASLSACQELAAQANGYPSFHAATIKTTAAPSEVEADSASKKQVNAQWKLHSQNHEGCLAEIGGVVASMSKETLKALSLAHADIHAKIGSSKEITIVPKIRPDNGWTAIGFDVERNVYSLNLRGICWEVSPEVLDGFVRECALPFIASAEESESTEALSISRDDIDTLQMILGSTGGSTGLLKRLRKRALSSKEKAST